MQFSQHSRVWVYQADRELTLTETAQLQQQLNAFTLGWAAHNNQLTAGAEIRYNRFIILFVDESQTGASGCSIDKSVNFMKEVEKHYQINLFDRFNTAYRNGSEILSANREEFEELVKQGLITEDTIVFNNTIQTIADLNTKWEVPFRNSWHNHIFGRLINA